MSVETKCEHIVRCCVLSYSITSYGVVFWCCVLVLTLLKTLSLLYCLWGIWVIIYWFGSYCNIVLICLVFRSIWIYQYISGSEYRSIRIYHYISGTEYLGCHSLFSLYWSISEWSQSWIPIVDDSTYSIIEHCQYKIDTDEPLFDVLIDDVVNGGDKSDRDSKDDSVIE